MGLVAARLRRPRRARARGRLPSVGADPLRLRHGLRTRLDGHGHGVDVAAHGARLRRHEPDLRQLARRRRARRSTRTLGGDRPAGRPQPGRGAALLVPVRRRAARQPRHRPGRRPARRHRPRGRGDPHHVGRVPGRLRARRAGRRRDAWRAPRGAAGHRRAGRRGRGAGAGVRRPARQRYRRARRRRRGAGWWGAGNPGHRRADAPRHRPPHRSDPRHRARRLARPRGVAGERDRHRRLRDQRAAPARRRRGGAARRAVRGRDHRGRARPAGSGHQRPGRRHSRRPRHQPLRQGAPRPVRRVRPPAWPARGASARRSTRCRRTPSPGPVQP